MKLRLGDNGKADVIIHPLSNFVYSNKVEFDVAFHRVVGNTERLKLGGTNELGSTTELDVSGIPVTQISGYTFTFNSIKCIHESFKRPVIPPGLSHSSLVSISLNTKRDVEIISKMMEKANVISIEQIPKEPLFEIVSVTHMGYAWANQSFSDKHTTYTVFYQMRL